MHGFHAAILQSAGADRTAIADTVLQYLPRVWQFSVIVPDGGQRFAEVTK
jgi:hypothetical protein